MDLDFYATLGYIHSMPSVTRKLLFLRNLVSRKKPEPDEIVEEKWVADFSKQKNARFIIKSESSYDAKLRKNSSNSGHSLVLGLKKTGCIAWVEAPEQRYRDHVISGSICIDARGGYGAGGILFRMVDGETYYSFIVSSKNYFRLDAVRNGMPLPLVGWTEMPIFTGAELNPDQNVDFSIISYGSHIIILIQGRWVAEVSDSSILEGNLGFTAVSYEPGDPGFKIIRKEEMAALDSYTTEVFLTSLIVESHITDVSALYEKWNDSAGIDGKARFNLAETYTAMNQPNAAMVQLRKAWNASGYKKNQRELLLAGRLAQQLGLIAESENYISQCFQMDVESREGREAVTEMSKILYAGERYKELKNYCEEAIKIKNNDPVLWTFMGHAYWNLEEYKKAAASYDTAFELEPENGIFAKNAANVYDVMGRKKEALNRYLEASSAFLQSGNYNDLGLLVPTLLTLGEDNHEARSLRGKWAFAVEDWEMASAEFIRAEELRKAKRPKPSKDGAQVFLEALLLLRTGKRLEALPLLKEAVSLEKNYALFHFRLAENLFLLDDDPDDPLLNTEMSMALSLCEAANPDEGIFSSREKEDLSGWINNFAAQVALRKGTLDAAAVYLEKAVNVLGDLPVVSVNRGVLLYLRGSVDKALEILDVERKDDPEGIMANCAGNLLVRSGRYEEADDRYRKALSAMPDNVEYLCNRSSCLMELGLYGEADELLAKAHTIAPSPAILEMLSFVAVKKGEYKRAEQACRMALEMDPFHVPSLLSLGWIFLTLGYHEDVRKVLVQLDKLVLKKDSAKGREELRTKLDDLTYKTIECPSCRINWKILKDPPAVPSIRLFAMPPDNLPAGSCPECGKSYCIGCAKKNLDPAGRFICPDCNRPLKLVNEGLKKILYDWAATDGLVKPVARKKSAPETKSVSNTKPVSGKKTSAGAGANTEPEKRGRGRPHKTQDKKTPYSKPDIDPGKKPAKKPRAKPAGKPRGRPRKNPDA